jgi:isopenicillin-N epimerase
LDPAVTFLNHGSFGACPAVVLERQAELRARLEREPVQFFLRELEPLLDAARAALGGLLDADADDLALVPNASTGVATVLRSLSFSPGDELLTTNHAYNACRQALEYSAAEAGAKVVVAAVPFPINSPEQVTEAVLGCVSPRTRLALLDHVTSQTALVFPIRQLVSSLRERGVETLVDGAHAPGMLPVSLRELGAAYYTGNCHKWLCAPKGAAFLHVRRDRQKGLVPLVVSHGHNSPRTDRSRFRLEFDWTGTVDPSALLCIPDSLRFLSSLLPGGLPELMARNHATAVDAQRILCRRLGTPAPCPEGMLGAMAAVPLPDGQPGGPPLYLDPLYERLFGQGFELPVFPWPAPPKRVLRVSTPAYVSREDIERLAAALPA